MPRRGKKKGNALPLLVAPEPLGDELEADIMWDRVKEVNDKPAFMDGLLLDATRCGFEADGLSSGLGGDGVKKAFVGRQRFLNAPRAREQFLAAEEELKQKMEFAKVIQDDADDFDLLKQNEMEEFEREREAVLLALKNFAEDLSDARLALSEKIETFAEKFFDEQKTLLDCVCGLAARGKEVEEAFIEQAKMRKRCSDVVEAYFSEHGKHVLLVSEMQKETKERQEEMLQLMIQRLQSGVDEMTKLSVKELEDKDAQQEETSHLIVELLKLQGKSVVLEKKTTTVVDLRANLQRMITLELQKHKLCTERQKQLQREVKSLSTVVKENNTKLLALTSYTAPTVAYTAALATISTAPNTIASLNTEREKNLQLLTIEAQRELQIRMQELAKRKDELWALRRQHLIQLSGRCQAASVNSSFTRFTQDLFYDAETRAAIRSVVVESLLEVSHIVEILDDTGVFKNGFDYLLSLTDMEKRKSVQNYVVRRINKLFSSMCPTTPLFSREATLVGLNT